MKNQVLTPHTTGFMLASLLAVSLSYGTDQKRGLEDISGTPHKITRSSQTSPSFQFIEPSTALLLPEPKPASLAPYKINKSDPTKGCEITFVLNAFPQETQTYSFKEVLRPEEIDQAHDALHKLYTNLSMLRPWFQDVWKGHSFSNITEFLKLFMALDYETLTKSIHRDPGDTVFLNPLPFHTCVSDLLTTFSLEAGKFHQKPLKIQTSFFTLSEEGTQPPAITEYKKAPISVSFCHQKVLLLPPPTLLTLQQPDKILASMTIQNVDYLYPFPFQRCTTLKALKFSKVANFSMVSSSVPTSLTSLNFEHSGVPSKSFIETASSLNHIRLHGCKLTDKAMFLPTCLTHLELSNASLTDIPKLQFFTNLVTLSLDDNFIMIASDETLPTSLHYLNLANNPIYTLSLPNLKGLEILQISTIKTAQQNNKLLLPPQRIEIMEIEKPSPDAVVFPLNRPTSQ